MTPFTLSPITIGYIQHLLSILCVRRLYSLFSLCSLGLFFPFVFTIISLLFLHLFLLLLRLIVPLPLRVPHHQLENRQNNLRSTPLSNRKLISCLQVFYRPTDRPPVDPYLAPPVPCRPWLRSVVPATALLGVAASKAKALDDGRDGYMGRSRVNKVRL